MRGGEVCAGGQVGVDDASFGGEGYVNLTMFTRRFVGHREQFTVPCAGGQYGHGYSHGRAIRAIYPRVVWDGEYERCCSSAGVGSVGSRFGERSEYEASGTARTGARQTRLHHTAVENHGQAVGGNQTHVPHCACID